MAVTGRVMWTGVLRSGAITEIMLVVINFQTQNKDVLEAHQHPRVHANERRHFNELCQQLGAERCQVDAYRSACVSPDMHISKLYRGLMD